MDGRNHILRPREFEGTLKSPPPPFPIQVPGVAGELEVVTRAYPDPDALEPGSKFFDAKHTAEAPRWFNIDVKLVRKFPNFVPLTELKARMRGGVEEGGGRGHIRVGLEREGRVGVHPPHAPRTDGATHPCLPLAYRVIRAHDRINWSAPRRIDPTPPRPSSGARRRRRPAKRLEPLCAAAAVGPPRGRRAI